MMDVSSNGTNTSYSYNATDITWRALDRLTEQLFNVLALPACVGLVCSVCLLSAAVRSRGRADVRPAVVASLAAADVLVDMSYLLGYLLTMVPLAPRYDDVIPVFILISVLHGTARMAHSWSVFALIVDRLLMMWWPGRYERVLPASYAWLACLAFWLPAAGLGVLVAVALLRRLPLSIVLFRDSVRLVPLLTTPLICVASYFVTRRAHMRRSSPNRNYDFTSLDTDSPLELRQTHRVICIFTFLALTEALSLITAIVLHSREVLQCHEAECLGKHPGYYQIAEAVALVALVASTITDPVVLALRHRQVFCCKKCRCRRKRVNDKGLQVQLTNTLR